MKAGLFGGTFNPIHNGHIAVIKHVKKEFKLEKIYLIPSALPPHKPDKDLAAASQRYDMVVQTIENLSGFHVSDKEVKRDGPSYTIDTISEFKKETDIGTQLFLIMGSDAFFDITTWKNNTRIFEEISVIVMLRPGDEKNIDNMDRFIDEKISKGYKFDHNINAFFHEKKKSVHICNVPKIQISSTMIRNLAKQKKSIKNLVPLNVENLIIKKGLYL